MRRPRQRDVSLDNGEPWESTQNSADIINSKSSANRPLRLGGLPELQPEIADPNFPLKDRRHLKRFKVLDLTLALRYRSTDRLRKKRRPAEMLLLSSTLQSRIGDLDTAKCNLATARALAASLVASF
jgi:hypothetical protein